MGRKTKRKFGYVRPAPRLPLALDATAFPHLLDLVISFATPDALLSLSQTCRSLRSRLATSLYSHIVVSEAPPSTSPDNDRRDGLEAALEEDTCHNVLVSLPSGRRVLARDIPALPNPDIPFDREISRLLARASVVSFVAPIPPALADACFVLGRQASTVRLIGGGEYPAVMGAASTLVALHTVVLGRVATAVELHVPSGTRRVVLHYSFDAAASAVGSFPVDVVAPGCLPGSVEEVVLVFADKGGQPGPEPLGADALWKSYLLNAATGGTDGGMFATLERGVRWVFVDCARLGSWIEPVIWGALESYVSGV